MKKLLIRVVSIGGLLGIMVLFTGCTGIFGGEEPEAGATLVYHSNGAQSGSVPVDSRQYLPGDVAVVFGNTGSLAKPGFSFSGWNTQADGGGTPYAGGDSFIFGSESANLYAQWQVVPETYLVTYDGNGADSGEPPVDNTTYQSGASVTAAVVPGDLTRSGYGILSWNTEPDGSGVSYAPGDSFLIEGEDVTLYAEWFALVADVALGYDHSFIVTTQGTLFAMGRNSNGQLGLGDTDDRLLPTPVPTDEPITAASAGLSHSLLVDETGAVWAAGWNIAGQLGLGDTDDRNTFTALTGITNGLDVQAAYAFSTILTTDGTVFGMGQNQYGQIGDNTTTDKDSPAQSPGITTAVALASAGWAQSHTIILTSPGSVLSVGANHSGQLGVGDTTSRSIPAAVSSPTDVVAISTGGFHTLYLTADGTLYGTGSSSQGQLGGGANAEGTEDPYEIMTGVAAMSAGDEYSMVITQDGTLLASGLNEDGQLGLGHTNTIYEFLPVMDDVAAVYAGIEHTLIVKTDGTLWAAGANDRGQLGDGTLITRPTPVRIIY